MVSKYSSTVAVNASSLFTIMLLRLFEPNTPCSLRELSCTFLFLYSPPVYSGSRKEIFVVHTFGKAVDLCPLPRWLIFTIWPGDEQHLSIADSLVACGSLPQGLC